MKKITYIIVLFILSITLVNAKNCTVISGTGKNIGDEIACGTEHFYVVSNDGTNVKMLSKYNLLTNYYYGYWDIEDFTFKYWDDIYKNKQLRDKINETGILLEVENTYNSEAKESTGTALYGTGNINKTYQVVVFDEEVSTSEEVFKHPDIQKVVEKGYRMSQKLTTTGTNYFGAILIKDKNYSDYKTVFLDGTYRSLRDLYQVPEIKELLEQGYIIDTSYSNKSKTTNNISYYDCYAVSLSKEYDIEYKTIFLDGSYIDVKDLINLPEVKQLLEQGYKISEEYSQNNSQTTTATLYDYYMITFSKEKNEINKTIFVEDTHKTLGELINLPEVKTLLEDGYTIHSIPYYYNSDKINNEFYYNYVAVTLRKHQNSDVINIIFDESIYGNSNLQNYINGMELIIQKTEEGYVINKYEFDDFVNYDYIYYGVQLELSYTHIYQDERALGINGDVNGPNYPFYGVVGATTGYNVIKDGESYEEYYTNWYIERRYSELIDYKMTLRELGYQVNEITTLSVDDLNQITEKVTGKSLPLKEWYENKLIIRDETFYVHYIIGNLKDIYNESEQEKYGWLWGTSYWLRTIDEDYYMFNMNTLGDLCLTDKCSQDLSRGLRPLVTMSATNINYPIETKIEGKGTIEVNTFAENGEEVQVTITPKKGYDLKEVKVTDAEGNVLIFTNNTFTMPASGVTIEAIFEISNPNTSATNITILILLGMCSIFAMKKHIKRIKWLTN